MNISLTQKEITAAVRAYVANHGIGMGFVLSEVKFSTTRKPASITAELILEDANTIAVTEAITKAADKFAQQNDSYNKAVNAAVIDQTSAPVTSIVKAEETKSVPEEKAEVIDAGVVPEPTPEDTTAEATTNTTSLFG